MKSLCVAVITFLSVASLSSAEEAQAVKVTRIGTQPSAEGPAKNFTGIVRIDSRLQGPSPARIGGATVILRAAFGAHRRGEFELSVPVFLAQSDGVCLDLTGYHFFMRDRATQKPKSSVYVAARVGNEVSSAMLSPLTCVLPINAATKEREKTLQDKGLTDWRELNRHMVLHGESLDYGTQVNSLKAISLINYFVGVLPEPS